MDHEIISAREEPDSTTEVVERRASSGVRRAGMLAGAGLAAGLVVGCVAFLVIWRRRKPTVRDRIHRVMPDFTDFRKELQKRFDSVRPTPFVR